MQENTNKNKQNSFLFSDSSSTSPLNLSPHQINNMLKTKVEKQNMLVPNQKSTFILGLVSVILSP